MDRKMDGLLEDLKGELLQMSAAVEESIAEAIRGLTLRDDEWCRKVEAGGKVIDDWEVTIEDTCLKLLAMQQPVASDLRLIAASMKINYDLERINDQAVNIAQRAVELNKRPLLKPLIDIPRMAEMCQAMVKDALDAFVNHDLDLARDVGRRDEEVDQLRDQIFRELLTYMQVIENSDTVDRGILLILVSRHLERIGDHASNIAENAFYLAEGRIVRHQKAVWWEETDAPEER